MQNSILNTPYYEVIAKEDALFEHAYRNQIPLLLKGPTGSGKSRFVEYMAAQLGLDLITISCHEETSATDLIGRFIIKGSETVWLDGPLSRAVRSGCMVYLDEIAEARPDVLVSIIAGCCISISLEKPCRRLIPLCWSPPLIPGTNVGSKN